MITESELLLLSDEQRNALVKLMAKVEEGISILAKRDVPGRKPGFYKQLAKTGEGGPITRRGHKYSSSRYDPYFTGGAGKCDEVKWYYKYAVYSAIIIGGATIAVAGTPYVYTATVSVLQKFMVLMGFDVVLVDIITYLANLKDIIGPAASSFFCGSLKTVKEFDDATGKFVNKMVRNPQVYQSVAAYKMNIPQRMCSIPQKLYKKYWRDVNTTKERAEQLNKDISEAFNVIANTPSRISGAVKDNLHYLKQKQRDVVKKVTEFKDDLQPIWKPIYDIGKSRIDVIADFMCDYIDNYEKAAVKPVTPDDAIGNINTIIYAYGWYEDDGSGAMAEAPSAVAPSALVEAALAPPVPAVAPIQPVLDMELELETSPEFSALDGGRRRKTPTKKHKRASKKQRKSRKHRKSRK